MKIAVLPRISGPTHSITEIKIISWYFENKKGELLLKTYPFKNRPKAAAPRKNLAMMKKYIVGAAACPYPAKISNAKAILNETNRPNLSDKIPKVTPETA